MLGILHAIRGQQIRTVQEQRNRVAIHIFVCAATSVLGWAGGFIGSVGYLSFLLD